MAARGRRQVMLTGDAMTIDAALRERRILDVDVVLLEELRKRPLPVAEVLTAFSRAVLDRVRTAGLVAVGDQLRDAVGVRYDRFAILETSSDGLPPKQATAVEQLRARGGEIAVRALESPGVSAAVLGALARKGIIRIERRARRHTLDAFLAGLETVDVGEIRHSDEQQNAIAAIKNALGTFSPFLLEGVTGSGKTEVYIEVMREAVRRGEQALLLVPEISLTPQIARRFEQAFGERKRIVEFRGAGKIAHAKRVQPVQRTGPPLAGDDHLDEKSLRVHGPSISGVSQGIAEDSSGSIPPGS